jgi:hypothetical protein
VTPTVADLLGTTLTDIACGNLLAVNVSDMSKDYGTKQRIKQVLKNYWVEKLK